MYNSNNALSVPIPWAKKSVGNAVVEAVAFTAAPDAALVRVGPAGGPSATVAVFQQARDPLQAQVEAAGAGLPQVSCGGASLHHRVDI